MVNLIQRVGLGRVEILYPGTRCPITRGYPSTRYHGIWDIRRWIGSIEVDFKLNKPGVLNFALFAWNAFVTNIFYN